LHAASLGVVGKKNPAIIPVDLDDRYTT